MNNPAGGFFRTASTHVKFSGRIFSESDFGKIVVLGIFSIGLGPF
jgi:hypothetical protein